MTDQELARQVVKQFNEQFDTDSIFPPEAWRIEYFIAQALADARREALEPWEVWIEKLYELLNDPLKSQTERLIEAEQMVRGWRVPKIREAHWKEYCRQRASEG